MKHHNTILDLGCLLYCEAILDAILVFVVCFLTIIAILTFLTFGKTSATDHCYDGPCKNNGSCVNSEDGYQCVCSEEFTGANCEGKFYDSFLPNFMYGIALNWMTFFFLLQ